MYLLNMNVRKIMNNMKMNIVFILAILFLRAQGEYSVNNRSLVGYPNGMLSDCDEMDVEPKLSENSKLTLTITVLNNGSIYNPNVNKYNYKAMKELARTTDFTKKTIIFMTSYVHKRRKLMSMELLCLYKSLGYNAWEFDYFDLKLGSLIRSSRYMQPIGKHFAEMLKELTSYGLNPQKLELIGFNHGAHGIGFIAKQFRNLTGRNITRLTGLSPSGICFRNLGPEHRLDDSDADFVDVVHTNIDGYGMAAPLGHINFYVNGGEYQVSDIELVPCMAVCSNWCAIRYWMAAVQYPKSFIAVKCGTVQDARDKVCFERVPRDTNVMGPNVDRKKPGIYFLATDNSFPYHLGEDGLKREFLYDYKYWAKAALVTEM